MKTIGGYILAALILIGAFSCYQNVNAAKLRAEGALAERTREWNTERDSMRNAARKIDTLYRDKLKTFTRTDSIYDTVRVAVETHITDTVLVKEFIHIADSTINTCKAALSACSLLNQNLALQLTLSDSVIKAQKRLIPSPPSWLTRTARNVEHVFAIVGVGAIAVKVIRE
jgi:hypothetical protein